MASSSGQDKERERRAQERDFNTGARTTPNRTHAETSDAHVGNLSSDSSSVIGKGRDRRTGAKK